MIKTQLLQPTQSLATNCEITRSLGGSSSGNLSVFASALRKLGFQAIRNPERLDSGCKQSNVVPVVQGPESKCPDTLGAERPFNTLQFIVAALIIHLVKCLKTGQQEEPLQSAD